jgi:hypothetical protein
MPKIEHGRFFPVMAGVIPRSTICKIKNYSGFLGELMDSEIYDNQKTGNFPET